MRKRETIGEERGKRLRSEAYRRRARRGRMTNGRRVGRKATAAMGRARQRWRKRKRKCKGLGVCEH